MEENASMCIERVYSFSRRVECRLLDAIGFKVIEKFRSTVRRYCASVFVGVEGYGKNTFFKLLPAVSTARNGAKLSTINIKSIIGVCVQYV